MRRTLAAIMIFCASTQGVDARKAKCSVPDRHDLAQLFMAFEIDDSVSPFIFKINGVDEGASDRKTIDIPLLNLSTARIEAWYLGSVERSAEDFRSIYRMHFGEAKPEGRGFQPMRNYTLYMDWKAGTAAWLDEDMAFNGFKVVEDKPNLVIWAASCHRLD